VLVTFTHICILVESGVANVKPSSQTASCGILEKKTFWKVAYVVRTRLSVREILGVNLLQLS